jgi:hypothetical protein
MINQIVYHHLHLFNRIEVNTIDESMKIGIWDCDIVCIE